MSRQIQINLSDIIKDRAVFWSTGNQPTQLVNGLSQDEVVLHLKALYLLSDKVLAAASYFFESSLTREATQILHDLFERGEVLFFVDTAIEDFSEHGARKFEKSPPELTAYQNSEIVQERANVLDSLGYILRRPSHDISERIADLWIDDMRSSLPSSMGEYLQRSYRKEDDRVQIELKLVDIAKNRNHRDFVWEYLKPRLIDLELPKDFLVISRRKLAQMYAIATAELLGVPLDQSSYGLVTAHSQYDSNLFLSCMDILGLSDSLRSITAKDLVFLKYSAEFTWFKSFYFKLIEIADYNPSETREWLLKYRDAAQSYTDSAVTTIAFLKSFRALCTALGKSQKRYILPLEILLYTYESVNKLAIESFTELLQKLAKGSPEVSILHPIFIDRSKKEGATFMTNYDPIATMTLMKAVDFLFGEAKSLMDERRRARKERGKDEDAPEIQHQAEYTDKEEVKSWQPKNIYVKDWQKEVRHCIEQMERCRGNRRHIESRIEHVGGSMHAPIELINDLEEQEASIKKYADRLKDIVEKVYTHKINIVGFE